MAASDVPPKPTLFCRECGYHSRCDGAWHREATAGATRYRCPDCETAITVRPGDPTG